MGFVVLGAVVVVLHVFEVGRVVILLRTYVREVWWCSKKKSPGYS